jgi:hypothetical protein
VVLVLAPLRGAIAADVLTEITERGTRRLATHLSTPLQAGIRDYVIEELKPASAEPAPEICTGR